jgi:hypothetical protein
MFFYVSALAREQLGDDGALAREQLGGHVFLCECVHVFLGALHPHLRFGAQDISFLIWRASDLAGHLLGPRGPTLLECDVYCWKQGMHKGAPVTWVRCTAVWL